MNVALTTFDADKTLAYNTVPLRDSATSSLIYIRLYLLASRYSVGVSISMVLKLFLVTAHPSPVRACTMDKFRLIWVD